MQIYMLVAISGMKGWVALDLRCNSSLRSPHHHCRHIPIVASRQGITHEARAAAQAHYMASQEIHASSETCRIAMCCASESEFDLQDLGGVVLQVLVAVHWIQGLEGAMANMREVSTRKPAMTRCQLVETTLARDTNTTSTGAMSTRTESVWKGALVYLFWVVLISSMHCIDSGKHARDWFYCISKAGERDVAATATLHGIHAWPAEVSL